MKQSMNVSSTDEMKQRFSDDVLPLLGPLLRVAQLLTHNNHAAEDLVQESIMRAYRHIQTFEQGTNLKAWLMTILRRTHIDLYRRDKRSVATDPLDAMDHEPPAPTVASDDGAWTNPNELLSRFDDDAIADALRELPEAMRWTLLLVDVEQMSMTEAAAVLDVAEGTIKSRASRARAALRSALLPEAIRRGWTHAATENQP